ncbi:hypothetical protein LOZ12_003917 [Ophidiomyces ophidiicola]|uniref:Uncharacterized protein n=1 Tax=Ophidiomyces ophidiicola TaxID=1387563 RepID=A0ACB8V1I7_9EURO|nr:uncharacterized protein LOZ57_004348 [Ophidiomyces ophidiicola]KAI1945317.1 hypothetical protein LOZ57_004348 [Ophidiomyces ophidiicola]KAI1953517.1 hypothetical protein LOZ62_001074 [Ophidiomyces ophidiicola]KAI1971893.1 hypothetical protein LOZ56_002740 [Ophidiomyces ophidiicola]KAI1999732.1 hypothetical protein LOZ50_006527 [Ophidiomyces ophidiicola]KAI2024254.1 hypothetical protein LOZ48_005785 [Ophidiomyces ophidiicola]
MTSNPPTSGLEPQPRTSQAGSQGRTSSGKNSPLPSAPTAAAPRSYASATKKSFSQAATSDSASAPSDLSAAQGTQHGQSPSTSQVNGKPTMQSTSIPGAGGPTIVNGNTASNDHARKPSVTISAAGASGFISNGGPISARQNTIRFGAVDSQSSPAMGAAVLANQQSLGIAPMNNRITSPDSSPSPIPQTLSGGRQPPSHFQGPGNMVNFGNFSGDQNDMNRNMRPGSQGPPPTHARRESVHSSHGDMGGHGFQTGQPRGGYHPPGGRGRNFNQSQAPFSSPGPSYRTPHNQRGNANMNHLQGRQLGNFPSSPRQTTRTPVMANANPATPPMSHVNMANPPMQAPHFAYSQNMAPQQVNQHPPIRFPKNHSSRNKQGIRRDPLAPRYITSKHQIPPFPAALSPKTGNFEPYLTVSKTQGYPQPTYDASGYYYHPQYQYPMPMAHIPPPSHPRPPFIPPQPSFAPGTYGVQNHTPVQSVSLSRSTSQVSANDRPSSSLSHGQQPPVPVNQGPSHTPNRSTNSPAPPAEFVMPSKKSHGVTIKNPDDGSIVAFNKPASSPAPRATPSPVKLGATLSSTPPPRASSRGGQELKTDAQEKIQSFQDSVRMAAEKATGGKKDSKLSDSKDDETSKEPTETVETATEAPKEAEPVVEKAPEKKEGPKPEPKAEAPQEDEIDFDAIERELAAKEAEELAKEKEYEEKKRRQKEEAARKAKEEAEAYEANMKKAEEAAEAAEADRLKKLATEESDNTKKEKADAFAALKHKEATSTESPTIETPAESGAATPVSDVSMGPPKTVPGGKREKPAALKLETNKTVEPPQPSAALKSLQTARFLDDPSKISYPSSIVSPNPALNTNAPADRKFKYNKEFLLQFQNVFKEKPSLDWDTKVRETVGDTSTDSRGSARTPVSGRNPSRPGIATNTFERMGMFQGATRTQTMPSGGQDRFPISGMRGAGGAGLSGNFGQFSRGPGGLTMGPPISRTNSSTAQQIPGSPRSGSHRGGRTASKAHKSGKKEEEGNKTMPLTAGLKIEPLAPSGSGWKPRSAGKVQNLVGLDGHLPPDVVQGKVKANLNKMTPEKFDKISEQILAIVAQSKDESDGRTLRQVIQLTFEKATDEAHWAPLYAKFCMRMLESMSPAIKDENIKDKHGNVVCGGSLFRKYLLNRCQEEFERGWLVNLPAKPEGTTDEAAMLSDEYYIAAAAKRRGLGLVKFIGELFKLSMLSDRIMHECVKKLVDYEGVPEEAEIESLTSLLRTIGATLDKSSDKGHIMMNAYFERIDKMVQTPALPSRLRFMLMDIIDLRKANWLSKDADKGPKTIQEIRDDAARAQLEQEMERKRQQTGRGSGGIGLGRGDARNFSGGYGNQPPLDYASSKVGSDDLRRLKAPRATNQPTSFSPSNLLGSRSSSGRRTIGPGGNLVRGGEDSGASSRTGTPPAGKKDDKESASSTNAFSALAGLDTGDSLATSPPSNPSSPQITKSRPAVEAQQANAPGKDDSAGAA